MGVNWSSRPCQHSCPQTVRHFILFPGTTVHVLSRKIPGELVFWDLEQKQKKIWSINWMKVSELLGLFQFIFYSWRASGKNKRKRKNKGGHTRTLNIGVCLRLLNFSSEDNEIVLDLLCPSQRCLLLRKERRAALHHLTALCSEIISSLSVSWS